MAEFMPHFAPVVALFTYLLILWPEWSLASRA